MAIHLDEIGIRDSVILERGPNIGGTWRDNVYPGAACDISSHLYSYSFDLNPDWSHDRARQPEIQAYLLGVVGRRGLRERIRFGCTATDASWSEDDGRWTVTCADGHVVSARFLVSAIGGLKDPRYPEIPGRGSFAGPALHTARWDPSVDLAGKRVGCIGTGASAIQLVPELAKQAGALTVFQRTPPWVIHRQNNPIAPWRRALFQRSTAAMRLYRLALYLRHEAFYFALFRSDNAVARLLRRYAAWDLARQVPDETVRAAVTPDYRLGCKRILFSDRYYPALQRDGVDVETTSIAEVVPEGVVLDDGRRVALDVLVYCTGFTVDDPLGPLTVHGADGRSLRERWEGRPKAWLGVTLDGFPNGFLLSGPNTGLGHNSVIVMFEAQMRYVRDAIAQVRAAGPTARIDLLPDRTEAFVNEVDTRHTGQVWASGCDSWYRSGDLNFTLWPGSTLEYRRRLQRFDSENYQIRAPAC
jgi:cation diffusion facilitator CzcD-associated flavoprotein CzcO